MEGEQTKEVMEESIEIIPETNYRVEFAKAALIGILGSFTTDDHKNMAENPDGTVEAICKVSYIFADGMMKEGGLK